MAMEINGIYNSAYESAYAAQKQEAAKKQAASGRETDAAKQTDEVRNAYTAKTSAGQTTDEYLSALRRKYPNVNITVADFSNLEQRKAYMFSCSGYSNVAISSNVIAKMASDPAVAAKYEKVIADTPEQGEKFVKDCEARNTIVYAQGVVIDKDGKVTYWAIGGDKEPRENPGTVYKEKVQKQLEEKRAKKKEEEKLKEKRLEQAETAEQLLEKMKAGSQTETAGEIAVLAEKIPEAGKGTRVDYII